VAKPAPKKSKRGGKRAGAGRPRDRLPQDMIDRVGAVPTTAAELDLWVRRLLAELLTLQMKGEVSVDLAASIRATCGEIRRGLDKVPSKPAGDDDDDDDDDEEIDGPELEEVDAKGGVDDGAIRVG
jgi:uncharacterized metal-binding protein YceD (DUF177 family)